MIVTYERMGRRKKPPTTHVRMRIDLAEMLEIVAAQRKKDLPELMDDLFRGIISDEYKTSVSQLQKLMNKPRLPIDK